jgi:hypothetical protein
MQHQQIANLRTEKVDIFRKSMSYDNLIKTLVLGFIIVLVSSIDFFRISLSESVLKAPFHWVVLSLGIALVLSVLTNDKNRMCYAQ